MIPKSYKTQKPRPSCANCKHVFIKSEHDCDNEFYCTFAAKPRPICMSVLMEGEMPQGLYVGELYDKSWDEWEKWSKEKDVDSQGICDNWSKKCLTKKS